MQLAVLLITIAVHHASGEIHFLALGDWGVDSQNQYDTAAAMGAYGLQSGPQFILTLGDNFYPDGVVAADDPRFNTTWKNVYNIHEGIRDLQWYISVGNHDYDILSPIDPELFQIEYGMTDPQWYLPSFWYDFTIQDQPANATVHFICIDTMALMVGMYDPEAKLAWFEQTISSSTADWIVVFGHHPPYNAGRRPVNVVVQEDVCTIIDAEVAKGRDNIIFLTGHDHNQQHIVRQGSASVDYIISGAGGKGLYAYDELNQEIIESLGMELKNFTYEYGFSSFFFGKKSYRFEFLNQLNEIRYSFSRTRSI